MDALPEVDLKCHKKMQIVNLPEMQIFDLVGVSAIFHLNPPMARVGLMISEEPFANLNLCEGGLLLLAFPVLFCDDSHCVKTLDPCLCNLELLSGLH